MTPGRPRSEATTRAVLDATLALLAEEPYGRLSIERIAATANVAKTAIYRRWASKAILVAEAVSGGDPLPPDTDSGDFEADLVTHLEWGWSHAHAPRRRLAMRVLVESHHDPDLAEAIRTHVIEPRRAALRRLLHRGIEEGVLAPGCDLDLFADLLVGPLLKSVLLEHGCALPADLPRRTVELALAGARGRRPTTVPS